MSLIFCKQEFPVQTWYINGDNVKVMISQYRINFYEGDKIIFSAKTDKDRIKSNEFTISKVGNNPVYSAKYSVGDRIEIALKSISKKHMKIHIGKPLNRTYTLVKNRNFKYNSDTAKYLKYLTDAKDFLNSVQRHKQNLYVANERYSINVETPTSLWDKSTLKRAILNPAFKWIMEEPYMNNPDKKPIRDITNMEDFLLDQNEKTGWVALEHSKTTTINFIFKSLQSGGQKLNRSVLLKAMGIYTGYGKTPTEFARYNRIKKLRLYFSSQYRGGIGKNRICFDENNFIINLPDKQGLHLIYFERTIPFKYLKFFIEDYYIGYDNKIGLNEVTFYVIDN